MAVLAPVAVVIAALAPGMWVVAPMAALALIALIVLDALIASRIDQWRVDVPADTEVGQPTTSNHFRQVSRGISARCAGRAGVRSASGICW